MRTIRTAIAIIHRSCSDSLLTASQMDGVFGSDSHLHPHPCWDAKSVPAKSVAVPGLGRRETICSDGSSLEAFTAVFAGHSATQHIICHRVPIRGTDAESSGATRNAGKAADGFRYALPILVQARLEPAKSGIPATPQHEHPNSGIAPASRQAASAIFSSARRSVMTIAPSEIRTSPVRCQLRKHLFTLSRVPPTMFASSR